MGMVEGDNLPALHNHEPTLSSSPAIGATLFSLVFAPSFSPLATPFGNLILSNHDYRFANPGRKRWRPRTTGAAQRTHRSSTT